MIVDGNEPHAHEGEYPFEIIPQFDIITPEAGKILHYDAVDLPLLYLLYQFFKGWSVKVGAGETVIKKLILLTVFQFILFIYEVLDQRLLV